MRLGMRICQLRWEKKVYQKDLADYLHVTVGTISNYENGVHEPTPEVLQKIADYFHVSVDYLLGRTKYPNPIDELNEPYYKDFMVSEMMDTTLSLDTERRAAFVSYLKFLTTQNGESGEAAEP